MTLCQFLWEDLDLLQDRTQWALLLAHLVCHTHMTAKIWPQEHFLLGLSG